MGLSNVFHILHDFDLTWCLPINTEADDLDLVRRSQVCQINCQFFFLVGCSVNVVLLLHTLVAREKPPFFFDSQLSPLCVQPEKHTK